MSTGHGGDEQTPLAPQGREQVLAATESWFVRHGLPYFVDSEREATRRGLDRSRLVLVVAAVLVPALVAGGLVGWVSSGASAAFDASLGVSTVLTCVGVGLGLYALTTLRAWAIARWAVARTLRSLGLLFPLVTRALPMLLLFVTFLFINAEVWQVSATLDGGVMWLTVLLFAGIAVAFLLVRLPEELDRVDDEMDPAQLVASCVGTPLEDAARSLAASGERVPVDASVRGFQKANLLLVLLVAQIVQVLLLSWSVFVFFLLFGIVVMKPDVIASWIGEEPFALGLPGLTTELVQVSVFLAAFSGLYFTVYAVTDELYRREFFTSITRELERAVGARTVYHRLRSTP